MTADAVQISPLTVHGLSTTLMNYKEVAQQAIGIPLTSLSIWASDRDLDYAHTAEDTADSAAHHSRAVRLPHTLAEVQAAADNVADYEVAGYTMAAAGCHIGCVGDFHSYWAHRGSLVLPDHFVDSYRDLAAGIRLEVALEAVCCTLTVRHRNRHRRIHWEVEEDIGCPAGVGCNSFVRAVDIVSDAECAAALIDIPAADSLHDACLSICC